MDLTTAAGLGVAALGGAAIGFERQWSGHASGPQARFGGIRTFTMLGSCAGLAGWLSVNGLLALGASSRRASPRSPRSAWRSSV